MDGIAWCSTSPISRRTPLESEGVYGLRRLDAVYRMVSGMSVTRT